jgi:hypothetical protein
VQTIVSAAASAMSTSVPPAGTAVPLAPVCDVQASERSAQPGSGTSRTVQVRPAER